MANTNYLRSFFRYEVSGMIPQKIFKKKDILQMDYVNFVLQATASSCRYGTMTETQVDARKKFVTRANINSLLILPFGSGKTSSLVGLKEAVRANDTTFPGLVGTINREGEFIKGSVMDAGGKLMLIDEFQLMNETTKNAMNSILEYPHSYVRSMGFKAKTEIKIRTKYSSMVCKAGSNTFVVSSKFSCIASGMYVSKNNTIDKAFFSRFIPVRMVPTLDYYDRLASGLPIYKLQIRANERDFVLPTFIYLKKIFFQEFSKLKWFQQHDTERGYSLRALQDIARLSCFVADLNNRSIVRNADYEFAMRFFKNMMANYLSWDLDEVDNLIIQHYNEKSFEELVQLTGKAKNTVVSKIAELRAREFLPEKGEQEPKLGLPNINPQGEQQGL